MKTKTHDETISKKLSELADAVKPKEGEETSEETTSKAAGKAIELNFPQLEEEMIRNALMLLEKTQGFPATKLQKKSIERKYRSSISFAEFEYRMAESITKIKQFVNEAFKQYTATNLSEIALSLATLEKLIIDHFGLSEEDLAQLRAATYKELQKIAEEEKENAAKNENK